MDLSSLKPAAGSIKKSKRVGRGQGSGRGGTSTRGHKGAKSRSGYSRRFGFEGGQMPLQIRVPKRGFKNVNRVDYVALNLDRLQAIADANSLYTVDFETLVKLGVVSKNSKVKVLGGGELSKGLTVKVHAYSEAAKNAIESQGGTAELI